jgi:hypothetical protein
MADLVTDPNDPRLGRGVDAEETDQHEAYLVLSEEERARGLVRIIRQSYRHVGPGGPEYKLRDLTQEERERYDKYGYVKFEEYPEGTSAAGRYWTEEQLAAVDAGGCGAITTMSAELAETYAKDPTFYGATYCVTCRKHLPVAEFCWIEDDGSDGPKVGT